MTGKISSNLMIGSKFYLGFTVYIGEQTPEQVLLAVNFLVVGKRCISKVMSE